jgi:hypothetical protein
MIMMRWAFFIACFGSLRSERITIDLSGGELYSSKKYPYLY